MIFAFLLLLQVVQYNVQGKHFLVETEDGNSLEENGPGQVYEYFLNTDKNTTQIVNVFVSSDKSAVSLSWMT